MTVGGNVLTPSSSNVPTIQLSSRLIVGLRLHGTIAALHPRIPGQIKCRPFLRYFAETLRRLHCDVTLFIPPTLASAAIPTNITNNTTTTNNSNSNTTSGWQITQLNHHEFPCLYRIVEDPTSGIRNGNAGSRGRQQNSAARVNFQDYLSRIAADMQTSSNRILFIDSEINYRFSPVQTLVLETFQPYQIREKLSRDSRHQRNTMAGDITTLAEDQMRVSQRHSDILEAEYAWTQGDRHNNNNNKRGRRGSLTENPCTPFSSEMCPSLYKEGHHYSNSNSSGGDPSSDVRAAALAIKREDYTLVALAGMLVELAAADVAVADYLRVEPLVEKLSVPFHGDVNYLPVENCEDMEQWDWETVEVREAPLVPDVEEREEHRNMFK
ncbi:uncharacterized protein TM35_000311890 [Trypanosoma theileri]|uniref:Uncharacterized protein n=1 Tax=Trypanosoma theileri TaxID=67003 RepID=A0A1X0NNC7_9TRYP|nr:uncharacterized protein TM35_000311890 [Trypanosoma theileri]ORC86003.1 hypothetical protein TM35_000311890 [Trypanosoma theileri]